ncbi:41179_t:CDS:2 [Gigaspora margarita]|uniref:41179_t:CDS:1 n=1 Tax=Gigaspora margarita TaxID=4874 RepID=A0ABM8W0E1_GIGMA|nr:41179_t:CDS:2 [Gigaspora margarita]
MSNDLRNMIALRPSEPATRGKPVEVIVNYLEVKTNFKYPFIHSYTFDVTIRREEILIARKKDSETVFYHLLNKKEFGQNVFPVYNGSVIFSYNKLCNGKNTKTFSEIIIPPKDGIGREERFSAVLKYIKKCKTYHMRQYIKVNANRRWGNDIQNNLRILNNFINSDVRAQSITYKRRHYFPKPDPQRRLFLRGGIELIPGLFQSVHPGWGKLLINIDSRAATFYPSGPLIDLIPRILQREGKSRDELRRGLSRREINLLMSLIKGISFTTTYNSGNNSKPRKKVSYITEKSAEQIMFNYNGRNISVNQYFLELGMPL